MLDGLLHRLRGLRGFHLPGATPGTVKWKQPPVFDQPPVPPAPDQPGEPAPPTDTPPPTA